MQQSRLITPSREELGRLPTPLTKGERQVLDFFDKNLPIGWEIYVQPHLNGLRPDFVLLHPEVGIGVVEVKDWSLEGMHEHLGKRCQQALDRLDRYKWEIFDLYCPRLDDKSGVRTLSASLIFTQASSKQICVAFGAPTSDSVLSLEYGRCACGREPIEQGRIREVFPASAVVDSKLMTSELAADFRNWLIEPEFSAEQREELFVDTNQRKLITTRTESGFRRIRGPAGSGKSLVLAARAAELASQGKEVLVVSFNITLINYLMDLAVRWKPESGKRGKTRSRVTWLPFHQWCKRACESAGAQDEYKSLWSHAFDKEAPETITSVLADELSALTAQALEDLSRSDQYDAILVDEGQDFLPSWWTVLKRALRPGGEMLLCVDATQNIYGTADRWTDAAMENAGFRGPWTELPHSYRMPAKVADLAARFANRFLHPESRALPIVAQPELDLYPCKVSWRSCTPEELESTAVDQVRKLVELADEDPLAIPDITFIVDRKETGVHICTLLNAKGIQVTSTFSSDGRKERRLKQAFFKGSARVKATTIHSFKGWESCAIVLVVSSAASDRDKAAIYTGLTRTKRAARGSYLSVVSADRMLNAGEGNT